VSKVSTSTMRDVFYFRQRQKNKVFQTVLAYFVEWCQTHDLSRYDLATIMNTDVEQVDSLLSGSGNWTLDTISDLLLSCECIVLHSFLVRHSSQMPNEALFR